MDPENQGASSAQLLRTLESDSEALRHGSAVALGEIAWLERTARGGVPRGWAAEGEEGLLTALEVSSLDLVHRGVELGIDDEAHVRKHPTLPGLRASSSRGHCKAPAACCDICGSLASA